MPHVVRPDRRINARLEAGGLPDLLAKPPAGGVTVRLPRPRLPRLVQASGPSSRPIFREGVPAVRTPALACRVGTARAVAIGTPALVRLGRPDGLNRGQWRGWSRLPKVLVLEQQVVG